MKHKNHEESDLQCNFSQFRNHMRKFYHKIFFIVLILRALDLFCFKQGVLLLSLITPGQNRGKSKFSSISREYCSRAIKVILSKIVFDFTVGRLSEDVKILPRWIYDFFVTNLHKEVVFKSAISTTSVSLTIKGFGHLTQLA